MCGARRAENTLVAAAVLAAHGCGVSLDHQECDGETTAFELRIAAVDCISGDGCTWGTQCTPIDCNSRAASRCTFPQCHPDSEACGWANSYIGLPDCTATLTTNCLPPCAGVSQSECASVPGCAWRTACTGHVIGQCADLVSRPPDRGGSAGPAISVATAPRGKNQRLEVIVADGP